MHPGMAPYQQNNSMGGYGQQGGQYGPQGWYFKIVQQPLEIAFIGLIFIKYKCLLILNIAGETS